MDVKSLLLRLRGLRSISSRSEGVLGPRSKDTEARNSLGPVTFTISLSQGPAFCYQIFKATMRHQC